jgi:phosphatidylethanolamine/phosphatidyl-N-methylethanolamine N-methyltransferase
MRDDPSWSEWEATLASFYGELNYGKHSTSHFMGAGHDALERLIATDERFPITVEVGVGTGEHLQYVRHAFDDYFMLDRSPTMLDVAKQRYGSNDRLHYCISTVERLPFDDASVDRLIATHVLEHIYRPHEALREWDRVIKPGGAISVLIPTDPGVAWRIGRAIGTRRVVRRMGLPYDYFMALEHVNPVNNLVALLEFYFPGGRKTWWPFRFASMDFNFFYAFHATKEKHDAAIESKR